MKYVILISSMLTPPMLGMLPEEEPPDIFSRNFQKYYETSKSSSFFNHPTTKLLRRTQSCHARMRTYTSYDKKEIAELKKEAQKPDTGNFLKKHTWAFAALGSATLAISASMLIKKMSS